jgi:hypothetical protein
VLLRTPVLAGILGGFLLTAAAAFAASQLLSTGAPVKPGHFSRRVGVGVAIHRGVELTGIATPDPAGGPPWTMRIYRTSRGLGCVQVARWANGRIGVIGQGGAFGDDGAFHPLPAETGEGYGNCVLLDAAGRAFLAMNFDVVPANGEQTACRPSSCTSGNTRLVFYGLLGPKARSITYAVDGRVRTMSTTGPDGAYLIAERANAAAMARIGKATPTVTPLDAPGQPIRKITYTGGAVCKVSAGREPCPPAGYQPVEMRLPPRNALSSPVKVITAPRRQPGRAGGRRAVTVSFTARQPVTSARSAYIITLRSPRGCLRPEDTVLLSRNVRLDEHVVARVELGNRPCAGTYRGAVRYVVEPSGPSRLTLAGTEALGVGYLRSDLVGAFHARPRSREQRRE